jgi:hypothetical protein
MIGKNVSKRKSHILAGLAAAGLGAAVIAMPLSADAQGRRGGGESRGSDSGSSRSSDSGSRGGGSSSRDSGSSRSETRRESPPPQRDSSPPRRDYTPPQRDSSSTRTESRPAPTRDTTTRDTTPRRDYTPSPRRDDTIPRRTDTGSTSSTPTRDDSYLRRAPRTDSGSSTGTTTRDDSYQRRAPRTDSGSTGSSVDRAPRRDTTPGTGSTSGSTTLDRAPRRDTSSNGGTYDRSQRDRLYPGAGSTTRDTEKHDTVRDNRSNDNLGPGGISNRRAPSTNDARYDRRDTGSVKTQAGSGRTQAYDRQNSGRDINRGPARDHGYDVFTRSREGRNYNNGIVLRSGTNYRDHYFARYFRNDFYYFPHYSSGFSLSLNFFSPYSYYYGVCPPYIYRNYGYYYPPTYVYVDVPVYSGNDWRGYRDDRDDRDYRDDVRDFREDGLDTATDDLREAFRSNDINPLVNLTDPNVKIAVFLKGKYEYSLNANDYLDMTRDMLQTTDTVQFDLTRFHKRAAGVYVISGKHVYTDKEGNKRTVYVSFVVERLNGRWTLTQVGTAPDHIQEWK